MEMNVNRNAIVSLITSFFSIALRGKRRGGGMVHGSVQRYP